jgi:cell division protein FtsQ
MLGVMGVGVLLALHTDLFSARHVTVRGDRHTPVATIEAVAGLSDHPPLVDVDPGLSSERLARLPWVAKAVVERRWPDSVTVTVTERTPVAAVALGSGGVAVVDATGRVLADESRIPAGTVVLDVPVAPGRPGSVLAGSATPALRVVRDLPRLLRPRVTSVTGGRGGAVTLGLAGDLTADLGPAVELGAKFEALESLLAETTLTAGDTVDLAVPYEPTVSQVPPAASRRGLSPKAA